ncbi:MAG: YkgJ family cysteine cluster protein [Thermoplasmata archaeon]|nr:YkgJ family cysteine cluster protein [Thermoplasmata archaeon]MCI4359411.1 YkgJ family cysteine cluster protein [Thermoplasmata archaeon]
MDRSPLVEISWAVTPSVTFNSPRACVPSLDAWAEVDLSLLEGVSFRCRPGCGLCCFTTPAADPREAERLIQLDPNVPWLEGEDGWRFVAGQGDGGACGFLSRCECRAYPARPFCCREYPLSVHLGFRAQATVVLSCPGVTVAGWGNPTDAASLRLPPSGLSEELEAAHEEFEHQPHAHRLAECARRWRVLEGRLRRRGSWSTPEEISDSLRPHLRILARSGFPPPPPPPSSGGVENLPLVFDPDLGLISIADHPAGWEVLSVEEKGGPPRSLGVWPAPDQPPSVTADGNRVLESYLEYLLRRDFTYWSAAERLRTNRGGSLLEEVGADLERFGALVLARAQLLERLHPSEGGPLTAERVWDGVRATDGEYLDRPTLGWVL